MPVDRGDTHAGGTPASYRGQLIAGTAGIDLDAVPYRLRLSNIPLFRDIDGTLHQAVRVRVGQPVADPLTFRLVDGDRAVCGQEAERADQPQSVFLLVPAVDAVRTLTFQAARNGEVVAEAPFVVEPQRRWTVHLIHHSHYDIGYTDPQAEVMASQLSYIDAALELAAVTDDWPDDARFRWNIEVTWPLREWLRTRPKAAREALLRRIHEGRIEVNALPFSMHTEAYSFDELARQLGFVAELREQHGIEVVSAMQTDVPGATLGLATLLTDAGIRYLAVAHNFAGRSIPHLRDGLALTRPFRWRAPDGDDLLVWFTDTLHGSAYMEAMTLGFGVGYEDVAGSLPEYLNALAQAPFPYDREAVARAETSPTAPPRAPYPHDILHLRVQGAIADNAAPSLLPSAIVREWNETWAFPHLRMSRNRDFFADAEARIGDEVATHQGDWTDWWADGIGSAAVALGKNRQSQADIRTAQTLNALADAVTDAPNQHVAPEVERAYQEMALFDEHTWGAANPWSKRLIGGDSGESQWIRKAAFAYSAGERVRTLLDGGQRRISPLAGASPDDGLATLLVFNPSSFPRTDLVRVFLPERSLEAAPFELVDLARGEPVPFVREPQENAPFRPRGGWLRFLARDVPPIGYTRYGLRGAGRPGESPVATPDGAGLATDRLAMELDLPTASIRSLVDRRANRDLVAAGAPFGFNAHIFDRYASAPGFNHLSSRITTSGPWLLGSRKTAQYGLVTSRESNAVWERVTVRAAVDGADWLETTLTLPHGVPRLHIANRLHKPSTMEKESLYLAFPFAVEEPEIAFEVTGGVVSGSSPRVPGSAHHFRAIRHWATITGDGTPAIAWATREAPLVQVGNIHLPYAPFAPTIPTQQAHAATLFSWALNNLWDTNFPPQQGGEMTFHYTVATGDEADPMALGRETAAATAMPLVGIVAPLGIAAPIDLPDRASFVEVAHPAVEVSHLTSSRTSGGIAVMLVSHAVEPVATSLRVNHLPVKGARIGSFLETDLEDVPLDSDGVRFTIAPGEMKALVLSLA